MPRPFISKTDEIQDTYYDNEAEGEILRLLLLLQRSWSQWNPVTSFPAEYDFQQRIKEKMKYSIKSWLLRKYYSVGKIYAYSNFIAYIKGKVTMYYLEVSDSWSRHCGQWLSKLEKSCIYWLPPSRSYRSSSKSSIPAAVSLYSTRTGTSLYCWRLRMP